MNVWTTLPRSLSSSRRLHSVRFLVGESSSSVIRHYSTNTQDDTRPSIDDKDRSSPPHILDQKIISEGKLIPSVANTLIDVPTVAEHLPVARLSHGLDRVLFKYVVLLWLNFLKIDRNSPGVHWLRDPRSGIYNFTPWLEKIPKVNDFAFERLTGFIKSSRDEVSASSH